MKIKYPAALIIIAFLILVSSTNNEDNDPDNYYPFVLEGKIWSTGSLGCGSNTLFRSDHITIGSDTSINEITWHILYECGRVSERTCGDMEDWKKWGYIREESQKVYIMHNDSTDGYLFYDFSLNADDEIEVYSRGQWIELTVDSVRYLPVLDNENRKHIFLSNYQEYQSYDVIIWIEGIGSTRGFFHNVAEMMVGGADILLCCEEDGVLIFSDSTFNSCYFEPLSINDDTEKPEPGLKLFPNPAYDILTLILEEGSTMNCEYKIIDINGRVVQSGFLNGQNHIKSGNLDQGIYFIQIRNIISGKVYSSRFIKN